MLIRTAFTGNIHGVGVDIEEVGRFKKILGNKPFLASVFTKNEIRYCNRFAAPEERLAARFAAKEAVMKSLGVKNKGIMFREIEILNRKDGAPFVNIKKKTLKNKFSFFISLSHSKTKAIAFSVITKGV